MNKTIIYKKKFVKLINHIITKLNIIVREKVFHNGGIRLKYMFFKENKSNVLLVGLQAFAMKGARYNYVSTVSKFKVNKLFILDDFSKNGRGSYYLGPNKSDLVEEATLKLIKNKIKETEAKKVVFFGSSKGGYSALNFSLDFPNSYCISACPQYFIGTFLDRDEVVVNLAYILGDNYSKSDVNEINDRLKNKIEKNRNNNYNIYLHYSDKEPTYFKHIEFLIRDLEKNGYDISKDIGNYLDHNDTRYYFPPYLEEILYKIIEEDI